MLNLRNVDLNLLTIFEAVYEERSQIKAAQRLGMTQPAVSNALSRLRFLVGDRLFLGRAKGLMATAKADDLYNGFHSALELIRGEILSRDGFDPAASGQTFVVTISYGSGALIGLPLFRSIRAAAPGIRLVIRSVDPDEEIPALLREQRLDLAFHHARLDDPLLEQTPFVAFGAVVVARNGHPRIESAATSLERLLKEEFVGVHDSGQGFAQNVDLRPILDTLRDRIVLEVPNTTLLPLVVGQTDLVAVMPRQLAEAVSEIYGLQQFPLPFDIPAVPTYLIWHPSRRDDQANQWLRAQCWAVAEELRQMPGDELADGLAGGRLDCRRVLQRGRLAEIGSDQARPPSAMALASSASAFGVACHKALGGFAGCFCKMRCTGTRHPGARIASRRGARPL